MSAAEVKVEMPVLVRSLKSKVLNLTRSQADKTFCCCLPPEILRAKFSMPLRSCPTEYLLLLLTGSLRPKQPQPHAASASVLKTLASPHLSLSNGDLIQKWKWHLTTERMFYDGERREKICNFYFQPLFSFSLKLVKIQFEWHHSSS